MSKKQYKPIFSYNEDTNKTAYLNWRTKPIDKIHNLGVIAEGYKDSALYLTKVALENIDDKKADAIIFSILFCANHAIELYLKEILWCQDILLEKKPQLEGGHNIRHLYKAVSNRVDKVLKKYDSLIETKKEYNKMTNNLMQYIDELYEKLDMTDQNGKHIFNMDFSRYPFSTNYQEHFYVKEYDNVVVDLENFMERMSEVTGNLNTLSEFFYSLVEMKYEEESMKNECYY